MVGVAGVDPREGWSVGVCHLRYRLDAVLSVLEVRRRSRYNWDHVRGDGAVSDTPPGQRSPDNVVADQDTLSKELTMVVDRHNGDLSHATIVRAVIDFADTYAELKDVDRRIEFRKHPETGAEVPTVVVPDADDGSVAPLNWWAHSGDEANPAEVFDQ